MKKVLVAAFLSASSPAVATSLIVQTHNGQVSIARGLNPMECKKLACRMQQRGTCTPMTCSETGEAEYRYRTSPTGDIIDGGGICSQTMMPYTPVMVECVE